MVRRFMVAGVVAFALLASGCSSTKTTTTPSATPSSSASSSSSEATTTGSENPLDTDKCSDLTSANLEMAIASTTEDAQKQADVFDKYNPPPDVQEAIDHFVSTKGPQFDDPQYTEYDKRITDWVHQECPT
jgi:hypothetical protein